MCTIFGLCAAFYLCFAWTAFVSHAQTFWFTWWGASFGAIYLILAFLVAVTGTSTYIDLIPAIPVTELTMRVQRRALSDALNALINAYESGSASSAAEETSSADGVAASDAYAVIFLHLAASWKDGSLFGPLRALNKMVSGAMLIVLAGIAVTAIAFGCVTAWQIFVVAWYLNYYAVLLLSVAAFNSRIHILTDLLCTAQLPIRDRLLAIARYGDTEAAAAKELAAHDARLDALVGQGRSSMVRVLGFEVDFGAVRAFGATLVTLGVAAFSIAKGAGVRFTMETFCPTGL